MDEKNSSNELIGKKMLETAILLDESLVEILKVEVLRLKKSVKNNDTVQEMKKTNSLMRNIIMALLLTDEKIKTGMELCFGDIEINNYKNMP